MSPGLTKPAPVSAQTKIHFSAFLQSRDSLVAFLHFCFLLNRLGNAHNYGKCYCWVLLNPSYLYKPVLCLSAEDLIVYCEEMAKCSAAQDLGNSILKPFCSLLPKFEFETNKNHQFGFVVLKERLSLKLADPEPQPADL